MIEQKLVITAESGFNCFITLPEGKKIILFKRFITIHNYSLSQCETVRRPDGQVIAVFIRTTWRHLPWLLGRWPKFWVVWLAALTLSRAEFLLTSRREVLIYIIRHCVQYYAVKFSSDVKRRRGCAYLRYIFNLVPKIISRISLHGV